MNGEPKVVDTEVLENLHDAIGDSLDHIIALYLDDVPENIQQMQNALAQNDLETIGRLAHSLKASSANLGAMQTHAIAVQLESAIKNGETDLDTIAKDIKELANSFDQTRPIFSNYAK